MPQPSQDTNKRLRVLIADGLPERLEEVAAAVAGLGHEAIPMQTDLAVLGELTSAEQPDVTIVIIGESSEKALETIGKVVKEAASPVIALLDVKDPVFVKRAAKQGVFAYVAGGDAEDLQSSFDIVLCRFEEYQNLEGAFGRRSMTERAKGILMERNGIGEAEAFNLLRAEARSSSTKLITVAEAIVMSHRILPATKGSPPAAAKDEPSLAEFTSEEPHGS